MARHPPSLPERTGAATITATLILCRDIYIKILRDPGHYQDWTHFVLMNIIVFSRWHNDLLRGDSIPVWNAPFSLYKTSHSSGVCLKSPIRSSSICWNLDAYVLYIHLYSRLVDSTPIGKVV